MHTSYLHVYIYVYIGMWCCSCSQVSFRAGRGSPKTSRAVMSNQPRMARTGFFAFSANLRNFAALVISEY